MIAYCTAEDVFGVAFCRGCGGGVGVDEDEDEDIFFSSLYDSYISIISNKKNPTKQNYGPKNTTTNTNEKCKTLHL